MSPPARLPHVTPAEFNIWEQTQLDRHELVDGVPQLKFVEWIGTEKMVGATMGHLLIVKNVFLVVARQLPGSALLPIIADGKVRTPGGNYRYPDVSIDRGPHDLEATELANPVAVIEVLSKSTHWIDHNSKLHDYQSVPTIQYILLLAQDEMRGQLWVRGPAGWAREELRKPEDIVSFPAAEVQFTLADAYEGIF